MTCIPEHPSATPRTSAAAPPHNLFAAIHQTLRLAMADTLGSFGRLHIDDHDEVAAVSDQLGALLHLCRRHLEREIRVVHPAFEACRPGATACAAAQCADNLAEIDALQVDLVALRAAPTAARASQLYRHFALFVAASLQHMHLEETSLNQLLCAEYGDAQLRDLEQHLLASDDPAARASLAMWMARAHAAPEHGRQPGTWPVAAAPVAPTGDVRAGDDAETSTV